MSASERKLLVVQVAGLGYDFLAANDVHEWRGLVFRPLESVFPALTCTVQASFRTGQPPSRHGMVANGVFSRELARPFFWEQSAALVSGPRIWEGLRNRGKRVALLFWQQSLGEAADYVVSPAPVHKHGGGMIADCYSKPAELYPRLCRAIGRKFKLREYWGPLASVKSSEWIAAATSALLQGGGSAPDLCLTYLPALDYDLQRFGPGHRRSRQALAALLGQLRYLLTAARAAGYEVIVFGDYAIGPVTGGAVLPNLALKRAGFFAERAVRGRLYADGYESPAFAMVDHEIAHVYVRRPADVDPVRRLLARVEGIAEVLDGDGQRAHGLAHPRNGELVLLAAEGYWFAYPWWEKRREAPDYAGHVDIHNKPGYDPCELFFGWPPGAVSQNVRRIRGSHGRVGAGRQACWAATLHFEQPPTTLLGLAGAALRWLEQKV